MRHKFLPSQGLGRGTTRMVVEGYRHGASYPSTMLRMVPLPTKLRLAGRNFA